MICHRIPLVSWLGVWACCRSRFHTSAGISDGLSLVWLIWCSHFLGTFFYISTDARMLLASSSLDSSEIYRLRFMHLGNSFGDLCVRTEKRLILHCVDLQHRKNKNPNQVFVCNYSGLEFGDPHTREIRWFASPKTRTLGKSAWNGMLFFPDLELW
jgi:hypothetical protein